MNVLRRTTVLCTAAALALFGIVGCSQGTGTERTRDEKREAARANPNDQYGTSNAPTTTSGDKGTTDPYATATTPPDATNTGSNANPENQGNPPFEQGTSQADRDLTAKIRKAVTDDTTLSTTAHNVKIISRDGKVLLKGAVQTSDERQRIETLATQAAGAGNVTNQIEVKGQS